MADAFFTRAPSTIVTIPLNGQLEFTIPFEFLARKFVVVTLLGTDRKVLTMTTDYRFIAVNKISLTRQPDGRYTRIELRRVTSATDRLVSFIDGSILRATDLNLAQMQTMHVAEEARDMTSDNIGVNDNGDLDARNRKIVNLADAENDLDAVNLGILKKFDTSTLNNANKAQAAANAAAISERNAAYSENRCIVAEAKSVASAGTAMTAASDANASQVKAKQSEVAASNILQKVEAASGPSVELINTVSMNSKIRSESGYNNIGTLTVSGLRAFSGSAERLLVTKTLSDGKVVDSVYSYSPNNTEADNGAHVIVDALGRRWEQVLGSEHTGMFWDDYGAVNYRIGDRLLVGDAVKNGRNIANQSDWLTQYQLSRGRTNGFSQSGQMVVQSGTGSNETGASNALVAGSQTASLTDNYNSIGVLGISVANKRTGVGNAYGGYFEGFRESNTRGGAYGIEVDSINFGSPSSTDPYYQSADQVIGVQIAAGGELHNLQQSSCAVGVNIQNNGSSYDRGINIGATAISGCDGVNGEGTAIALAKGHTIQWFGDRDSKTWGVQSVATAGGGGIVRMGNTFLNLLNPAGIPTFQVSWVPNSTTFLSLRPSADGTPIQLVADGIPDNIDIQLVPKGTGKIWLGEFKSASGTANISGYVEVKDATGAIRKLAVLA